MSRFKVLTVIALLLASVEATSDAGPFARWRANRHERISARINRRQDRVETRRYGAVRSGQNAGYSEAGYSDAGYAPAVGSEYGVYGSGSAGSAAYAAPGASSGSPGVFQQHSAPESLPQAPGPPVAPQAPTEDTEQSPSVEVGQWQPVQAPGSQQPVGYRQVPTPNHVPRTVPNLPPGQQPSPMEAVTAGLNALGSLTNERLVVFGSGYNAQIEITAARRDPTLTVVGIEIDPELAASAREYVKYHGLSDRITILTGDAITTPVQATIGIAFLYEDTLAKLMEAGKITPLKRFVSLYHEVPGLPMNRVGDVYTYNQRQTMQVATTIQQPTQQYERRAFVVQGQPEAWYNGRRYTQRRSCNCSMCRNINQQLASSSRQIVYRNVPVQQVSSAPQQVSYRAPVQQRPRGRYVTTGCNTGRCRRVWMPY